MDSAVRSTLGRRGSDTHLTRVHLEDTTARSAPRGYAGQVDLTGVEDNAGGLSTVSLTRGEGMSAEDATWENQHGLYTGRSAPTANGTEYEWRRLRWKVG